MKIGSGVIEISTTGIKEATAQLSGLEVKLRSTGAAANQANASINRMGSQGAMGLMMVSQTIDDMQYGFRAIVNNIPLMSSALGQAFGMSAQAAMKFGGIAGIAAVAINVIISHWDQLFQGVGYGTDTMKMMWATAFGEVKDVAITELDTIEARIKELEAKPIKMAVDMFELEQTKEKAKEIKSAMQAWEQIGKSKNPFEKAAGGAVTSALDELGQNELDALRDKMVAQRATKSSKGSEAKEMTEAEKQKIRDEVRIKAMIQGPMTGSSQQGPFVRRNVDTAAQEEAAIAAEQKLRRDQAMKVFEANKAQAKVDLGKMFHDAGSSEAVRKQLADALAAAGRGDLAKKVQEATPEGIKALAEQQKQDVLESQGARNNREYEKRQREKAEQEAGRVAGVMAGGGVGRKMLAGGMTDRTIEVDAKAAMQKAGMSLEDIGKILPEVVKKLKEDLDKAIKQRALDRGVSAGEAQRQLSKEAEEQAKKEKEQQEGPVEKSQVMSDKSYLDRLLTAGLSTKDNIPDQQLGEARTTNRKLDELRREFARMVKDKGGPATFARGRA